MDQATLLLKAAPIPVSSSSQVLRPVVTMFMLELVTVLELLGLALVLPLWKVPITMIIVMMV
jgi:hypothetical protein